MRTLEELFRQIESVPDFYGRTIDSVHYRNGYGDSPLHLVCCWGDCAAISLLLENGADINAKGESEFTALHYAVQQNHPEAVKLLLQNGALILGDGCGETPPELAENLEYDKIFSLFNSKY